MNRADSPPDDYRFEPTGDEDSQDSKSWEDVSDPKSREALLEPLVRLTQRSPVLEEKTRLALLETLGDFIQGNVRPGAAVHRANNCLTTVVMRDWDESLGADLDALETAWSWFEKGARSIDTKIPQAEVDAFNPPEWVRRILMIDDNGFIKASMKEALEQKNLRVELQDGLETTTHHDINVILLDHQLGRTERGIDILDALQKQYPGVLIICHTDDSEILENERNPYAERGVPVIGKQDLAALQGVLERSH